jgi:hypothetical protein
LAQKLSSEAVILNIFNEKNEEMSDRDYLGKKANEIPPEKLAELLRKGYTVSSNSGRLREKYRIRERKKVKFSKKKFNKNVQKVGWIILVLLFIASLVMLIPNIGDKYSSEKKKIQRRN